MLNQGKEFKQSVTQEQELTTSNSPSSTTTRVRARELHPMDIEVLEDYYKQNLGHEIPPFMARLMTYCHAEGMEVPVILEAIDITMMAPRPSGAYLRAVLQRWRMQGIHTEAQLREDERRHMEEKLDRGRNKWADMWNLV